jgi:hypothetical protein
MTALWLTGCSTGGSSQQQPVTGVVATGPECPLLAGKYVIQGEDGQVHISIEQEGCDRATIVRESGYLGTITAEKHVLRLDGTVQDDSPWLGSHDQYKSSAKFNESSLQIEAKTTNSTLTMIYALTPEGDLLEDALIDGRRTGGPVVAKRQN